jgi:glutamate-1-semialdehyde 2,1-aminomutase
MEIIAVTQARLGSTRLPNKIFKKVGGLTLLEVHVKRILASRLIDNLLVATTIAESDKAIVELSEKMGVLSFQGSESDVLDRFYQAVKGKQPDYVVRLTSDCPLIDPALIDTLIQHAVDNDLDYCSNTLDPKYPDGQDIEVFKFSALEKAWKAAKLRSEREHVTPYIKKNSTYNGGTIFKSANYEQEDDFSALRMTVDEQKDFDLIVKLTNQLGFDKDWKEYALYLENNPAIQKINEGIGRDEGYQASLDSDEEIGTGQLLYQKAKTLIPGGTMLLSKRPEMFLPQNWPSYYSKAKGCTVWDLDGKPYLDMSIMGIGTNALGYGHEAVDEAVRKVVMNGNMSTLNCPEEVLLAERLVGLHPWADMARFCRTGGEANAVAIRIARAACGKDKVAICGYHGWHDWYLSTNISDQEGLNTHLLAGLQPAGVPKGLANTTIPFEYNDIEAVRKIVAENPDLGVIKMEVSRNHDPLPGYLEEIREIATKNNIILIFDECTSGFRETFGGLHKKYGVEPDMAMFGKALGNGYAITAVIGKRAIMQAAQKTFISSTFWTERIGPTAALATLNTMEKEKSWETITQLGKNITARWKKLAAKHGLDLHTAGLPALTSFSIKSKDWLAYKTYITQEMLKTGILASNSVYPSTAHTLEDIDRYFNALDPIFEKIKYFEEGADVYSKLESPICHGGFKRLN